MPLVAAAVCPHPPLLVPEVASGAAAELDGLRGACADAVARLLAAAPDQVFIVGTGPEPSGAEIGRPDQPLSRAIGDWLLDRGFLTQDPASAVSVAGRTVPPTASPPECEALGRTLAATGDRLALLAMGDGSACRGLKAPGYDDPRAEAFDAATARALERADTEALLAIDAGLADELWCSGRASWQVLAGAVAADGRTWRGDVLYADAPYGVAYFVAYWTPHAAPTRSLRRS